MSKLIKGDWVMVFQLPVTKEQPEGNAELISPCGAGVVARSETTATEFWNVRFPGEEKTYQRWVSEKDRLPPRMVDRRETKNPVPPIGGKERRTARTRRTDNQKQGDAVMRNEGYALLMVLFTMVVLTVGATIALRTSRDAQQASYNTLLMEGARWDASAAVALTEPVLDSLAYSMVSGESHTYSGTLPSGGWFDAVLMRTDDGSGDRQYFVSVEAHDRTGRGLHSLVRHYTQATDTSVTFGECCDGAATLRGTLDIESGAEVSGLDEHPVGWGGTCGPLEGTKPGVLIADTLQIGSLLGGVALGAPPIAQAPLDDGTFNQFGTLSWDSVRTLADHAVGRTDGGLLDLTSSQVFPRIKLEGGEWVCDTSHKYNWGSNDPAHPCFDYMPIILIRSEVDLNNISDANGIFILDYDAWGGSELDIEQNVTLNGMILGKGCVEIQDNAQVHGAVFVDGNLPFGPCNSDATLDVHTGGRVTYSACAVRRALVRTGLLWASSALTLRPLELRSQTEPLR